LLLEQHRSHGESDSTVALEDDMLRWALVFFVIGIIAALLGFTGVAGTTFAIAKFLAGLFLVLFVVFLLLGVMAGRRIVS